MGNLLIELIEAIDEQCRQDGYYPDLVELNAMALAAIQAEDKPIEEVIADFNA